MGGIVVVMGRVKSDSDKTTSTLRQQAVDRAWEREVELVREGKAVSAGIFSGNIPGNLSKALRGEPVGTRIE